MLVYVARICTWYNRCPATLYVYSLFAEGLYGDVMSATDGSVEVQYGDQVKRTEIVADNDNPKRNEKFNFGPIIIDMSKKIRRQHQ